MAKKSFIGAIAEKTELKSKTGIKGMFSPTDEDPLEPIAQTHPAYDETPEDTRQSFVVLEGDMEKLKDYVFFKKTTADPLFSQKEAIHLALQLLFEKEGKIPERPEKVKRKERQRNALIRQKRSKQSNIGNTVLRKK